MLSDFAPAKINLCLHVTGQRADGYHLLDSLVVFAGVGDRLHAARADRDSLEIEGPFAPGIPSDHSNLVLKAADAMPRDFGVAFRLEKHLPPASGIGGGSADAAAALRLIRRMQGDPAGEERVPADLALRLGADLPICLSAPQPMRMRGIGEILELAPPLPPLWLVLVNPRVEVATPQIFRALARKDNPAQPEPLPKWSDAADLAAWLRLQRNDLEGPARQIAPVIGDVLAALRSTKTCRLARMSGSGATCFGLYDTEAEASAALECLNPVWWRAAAPLLGRGF